MHLTVVFIESGCIPEGIGNLASLKELSLNHNYLSGELPLDVVKMRQQWPVQLENNRPGFTLPTTIGALADLTKLDLSNCCIQGACPLAGHVTIFIPFCF